MDVNAAELFDDHETSTIAGVVIKPLGYFDSFPVMSVVIDGQDHLVAMEVGLLLGYCRGGGALMDLIRGSWTRHLIGSATPVTAEGPLFTKVKRALAKVNPRNGITYRPGPRSASVVLLPLPAVRKVLELSRRLEVAARLRDWLAGALSAGQAMVVNAPDPGDDVRAEVAALWARVNDLERELSKLREVKSVGGDVPCLALDEAQGAFCALWSRDLGSIAKTYQEVFRWAEASMERQGLARLVCGSEFKSVAIRNWLKSAVWCSFTAPDGQRYSIQESDGPRYWVRRD